MSDPSKVPPVPTARQVGPVFAFIGVGLIAGFVFVVGGIQQDNWPLLVVGTVTGVASAVWLVDAVRSLLRLIRLNRSA